MKKTDKQLYMIDCVVMHRIRYCVEVEYTDQLGDIIEEINDSGNGTSDHDLVEFSQSYLGEKVITNRAITKDEYLEIFDNDNDYLRNWTTKMKKQLINKIDETPDSK